MHPGPLSRDLHDVHRVSYSIGVAGQYLLHVRLRKQATSLPESPFFLTVEPGAPCALSSALPVERPLVGVVGLPIRHVLVTSDWMGNLCTGGGGNVTSRPLDDDSGVRCTVVDEGDGTYGIEWTCTKVGVYDVSVQIGGQHVTNSPTRVQALVPVDEAPAAEDDIDLTVDTHKPLASVRPQRIQRSK